MAPIKGPQVKDDLKSGNFKNVYLFFGEEDFLKDFYKNSIVKKLLDKSAFDFNYKEYNGEKPDNDAIEDFLNSYPFMSDWKILYIKNSEILKKPNEATKAFWAKILSDVPSYAMIIISEKNVDKRSSIYKEISKSFHAEEFPIQERAGLKSWITRYIGQYQKQMSADVTEYLLDCCSNSMYILKNELEKLASYKKDSQIITKADIDKCCCKVPESSVWEMINDIFDGKISSAAKRLEELRYQRQEPILINGAVFSKYSEFRKLKLLSQTLTAREIALKTKQKDFFVKKNLEQIKNFSLKYFENVMNRCADADRRIKQGFADGWAEIEIIFATMTMQTYSQQTKF